MVVLRYDIHGQSSVCSRQKLGRVASEDNNDDDDVVCCSSDRRTIQIKFIGTIKKKEFEWVTRLLMRAVKVIKENNNNRDPFANSTPRLVVLLHKQS